jgi:mercuric ion transport protein
MEHTPEEKNVMAGTGSARGALAAGGLAAILASTCCLGPLVLVMLGFSGAWIGNLSALEPYRPLFIGGALAALCFAWRQIFRPKAACEPDQVCAAPGTRQIYKTIFWVVTALVAMAMVFPYALPLFY